MAITVEIISRRGKIKASRGRRLADVLDEAGLPLSSYCRGRGLCGKCAVEIVEGALPDFQDGERRLLERIGFGAKHRLACLYELQGSVRISIPESSVLQRMPILSRGVEMPSDFDPAVKKFAMELAPPGLARPEALIDILAGGLRIPRPDLSLEAVRGLSSLWKQAKGRMTAVLYRDREILALDPGDTASRLFGLAVDLGTTTLVMDLVDLFSGRVLDSETALNSQAAYGADVVSRISLAFSEPAKADRLRAAIIKDLNRMTSALLDRNGLRPDDVFEAVIAGNTAMNHLLTGAAIDTLAIAPFSPVFSVLPAMSAPEVGLGISEHGRVYLAPNIKSFVGGDISAGLMVSGFLDKPGPLLYLDLGTNGEIALKKDDRVLVASTAAGPAFEGMNISQGMLAAAGAVCRVEDEGEVRVFTIGDVPARGICGSGLIDLAAVCLGRGILTPSGQINLPQKRFPVAPGVTLEQKDVRELQLAAAAVKSGMRLMLEEAGLKASDLRQFFIAGAFGSTLNLSRAMRLGLLPSLDPARVVDLGNASLSGARLLLLSLTARQKLESLAGGIGHFSLASQPGFQEAFIGALEFAAWS